MFRGVRFFGDVVGCERCGLWNVGCGVWMAVVGCGLLAVGCELCGLWAIGCRQWV